MCTLYNAARRQITQLRIDKGLEQTFHQRKHTKDK